MSPSSPLVDGVSMSVVCVDDDLGVLRVYARVFSAWGASVLEARSLATAREALARMQRPPELVMLDVHLPDGLGTTLLPELKRLLPPPFVVLNSAAEGVDAELADSVTSKAQGVAPLRAIYAAAQANAALQSALSSVQQLSRRQLSVLRHVLSGRTLRQTAELSNISRHTVRRALAASYRKLGARGRQELLDLLSRQGNR